MLDGLAPESELHVIDPLPEFDPGEHARRFPGRYVFHRDLSLNVLDRCGAFDVALIDGDHNWYTVYNELRLLESQSRDAGQPPPVLILHDVAWPYGRRDGYYAPEQVPPRFRQPNAQLGLERGNPGLLEAGGLNRHVWNAEHEGGSRNGVRTALDDFLGVDPSAFRAVVLDFFVGLAIAAPAERLASNPELAAMLDRLESPDGQQQVRDQTEAIARAAFTSGKHRLG
jgi:hypothetical protein